MKSKNDQVPMWVWFLIGFGLLVIVLPPKDSPSTYVRDRSSDTHTSVPTSDREYVYNRLRVEGYNENDSNTAADAIIKFHESQD